MKSVKCKIFYQKLLNMSSEFIRVVTKSKFTHAKGFNSSVMETCSKQMTFLSIPEKKTSTAMLFSYCMASSTVISR